MIRVGIKSNSFTRPRHGRSEVNQIEAIYRVLAAAIMADGVVASEEMARAIDIVEQLSGGSIPREEIHTALNARRGLSLPEFPFDEEFRVILFRMSADIVAADGRVEPAEKRLLEHLAIALRISHELRDRVLHAFTSSHTAGPAQDTPPDSDLLHACAILGIRSNSSAVEIQRAYRAKLMERHPDHAAKDAKSQADAHRNTQAIIWAYHYILRDA